MATQSTIPVPRSRALRQTIKRSFPSTVAALWALTKPDINLLIAITVFVGFALPAHPFSAGSIPPLFNALLGTLLVSSGAATLNQFVEHRHDRLMRRTARRPVALGDVSPRAAVIFGTCISLIGVLYLLIFVNPLSSMISGIALGIYLGLYTPLKRVTPMCTLVGAISGAAPPIIGWVAASGSLSGSGAWILYAILFLWQFPHFMAIAWMYRADYDRAGYLILPRCRRRSRFVALQAVFPVVLLIPCSVAPSFIGLAGTIYLIGALLLGIGLGYYAIQLAIDGSNSAARRLLFASIIYLPSVLFLMLLDKR